MRQKIKVTAAERRTFVVRLESLRRRRGMDQVEFAEYLGVSQPYYSQIISGHRMAWGRAVDFARKCGVSVTWLLGRDHEVSCLGQMCSNGGVVSDDSPLCRVGEPLNLADWGIEVTLPNCQAVLVTERIGCIKPGTLLVACANLTPRVGELVVLRNGNAAVAVRVLRGEMEDRWLVSAPEDTGMPQEYPKQDVLVAPVVALAPRQVK